MHEGEVLWTNTWDGSEVTCSYDMSVMMDFANVFTEHSISLVPTYTGNAMLIFQEGNKLESYTFSDKLKTILGFDTGYCVGVCDDYERLSTIRGNHRPYPHMGKSKLFVYCDLISPQFIGDALAPLLLSTPVQYDNSNHIIMNPNYFPVNKDVINVIHVYIRCEDGEPPPFELGTFSVTLSIRRSQD